MTSRYAKGLGLAFLILGAVLGAIVVLDALIAGRSPRVLGRVDVWLAFGLPTVALLGAGVGPIVLALRRFLDGGLTVGKAAAVGAAAGPLLLLVSWFFYREQNETVVGLLQFWSRLPAELIVGVLPHAAASAFFVSWLAGSRAHDGSGEQIGVE